MNYSPTYTALDLLETVIEFTGMTSDKADWSFEKQKYQRITRINTKGKSINELNELTQIEKEKRINEFYELSRIPITWDEL